MCPACMASAAMLVGSVVSTGGLAALAVKIFRLKKSDKASGPEKTSQRRTDHGNSDEQ
jgi:hypothetical protein